MLEISSVLSLFASLETVLQPVLNALSIRGVPIALSFCLVVMAGVALIWFQLRCAGPDRRAINELHRRISGTDGTEGLSDVRFAHDAVRHPTLRHALAEFSETLAPADSDDGRIRNTARPQIFFNRHELGLDYRFFTSIPNLAVGLGLLFTFLGLVAALSAAADGIATPDAMANGGAAITPMRQALEKLLAAASFKFYTSIAGLGVSIVASIFLKSQIKGIDNALLRLCETLERRLEFASPGALMLQNNEVARKQLDVMTRFSTDLAVSIGEQVGQHVIAGHRDHLQPALDRLTESINKSLGNIGERIGAGNQHGMEKIAESFQSQIGEQMTAQLAGINQALESMRTSLEGVGSGVAGRIEDAGKSADAQIQETIEGLDAKLSGTLGQLSEAVGTLSSHLQEAGGSFSQTQEQMRAATEAATRNYGQQIEAASSAASDQLRQTAGELAAEIANGSRAVQEAVAQLAQQVDSANKGFSGLNKGIDRQLQALTASADATTNAGTELRSSAAALAGAATPVKDAAQDLGNLLDSFGDIANGLETVSAEIAKAGQGLSEASATLDANWRAHSERFNGLDQQLGAIFEGIIENTKAYLEEVRHFLDQTDGQLSKAVDQLSGTTLPIRDLAEELGEFVAQQRAHPNGPDRAASAS